MKVLIVVLLLLFSGCTKEREKPESKVLAQIGPKVITVEDFEREVESLPDAYKPLLVDPEGKRRFLEKLVEREILLLEAERAGVGKREEVKRRMEECQKGVILEAFLKDIVAGKDEVTEEEIKKYYEEHKEEFFLPERIRVRHIVVPTYEEARALRERILKGEDFAELARKYSISPSAKWGGDLGYIQRGQVGKEFEKAAFSLRHPGEISDIVKTTFGYHIIRLEDRKPPRQLPLEEVRDEIREKLKERKRQKALEEYLKEAKGRYRISINETLLEASR